MHYTTDRSTDEDAPQLDVTSVANPLRVRVDAAGRPAAGRPTTGRRPAAGSPAAGRPAASPHHAAARGGSSHLN